MRTKTNQITVVLGMAIAISTPAQLFAVITHVIHVSVDGLRPDAITNLGAANLPNFYRMRTQGAFTDNARCDYDMSVTLPNHVTQLTGRGVLGVGGNGHNWTSNGDPSPGQTLASNKGSYVAGVYDVAHDNGLRTGHYASKSKFVLFENSWNSTNGAPDTTGVDNGRDKIDIYRNNSNTLSLTGSLVTDMQSNPMDYAFIHYTDPDSVGHSSSWDPAPGSAYGNVIKTIDTRLGSLFNLITTDPRFIGNTAIVLTADHGGSGYDHSNAALYADYRIPFYVWGPGVIAGADLYGINTATRLDPGTGRPVYAASVQPIRNGEAANLALGLLGLGAVPGSSLNLAQNLYVPEPGAIGMMVVLGSLLARRRRSTR